MTKPEDYYNLIESRFPDELADDVMKMIELIAEERIKYSEDQPDDQDSDKHYDFSAKIICLILDMFKTDDYKKSMNQVRLYFAGISKNASKVTEFKRSLSKNLLTLEDEREVYKRFAAIGRSALFQLPQIK